MTITSASSTAVRLTADDSADHPAWDRFVATTPGGHHVQTSMWARVKATMGWDAIRVLAIRNQQVVAGAQLLMRPIGRLGQVGYIANGPVGPSAQGDAVEAVMDHIEQLARERRILHLSIQHPVAVEGMASPADRDQYVPGKTIVVPAATRLVDLTAGEDAVLAAMHRKTRYNVRLSGRRGIEVREGARADLALYHQMVKATSDRRGFDAFPLAYYEAMWDALAPAGHLRLTVAEHENDPVAAQLAVPFGNTVVNKLSVWSGRQGSSRPNEALQWETMRWAIQEGYGAYDLEGIDLSAARLLEAGETLPPKFDQTTTSYKLGFGGRTIIAPTAQEYLYNRATRWAFAEVYPRVDEHRMVKKVRKRLRTSS